MIKQFLSDYYLLLKALHIIAVISWMAGMLYLPRLFVYHSQVAASSESYTMFCTMEHRLLKFIMNPSMLASFMSGIAMIWVLGFASFGKWLHVKLPLVFIMAAAHGLLAKHTKNFAALYNKKPHTYFRVLNEVPTVLIIVIVILAVTKPW